jgi:hypothetical protein
MGLRIVFETGPDQGRSFIIIGDREVRIGRGPGFHIVPRDPGWQGGLRITCSRGVYRITNEMAHDILRDGTTAFPQGAQEIWYHGATVQPTADTIVRAFVVEDPPDQEEPVVETTPQRVGISGAILFQWFVILSCLPAAIVLFAMPTGKVEKSPSEVRRDFDRVLASLGDVPNAGDYPRTAKRLRSRVQEARYLELWSRPEQAFQAYLTVREELDPLRADPEKLGKFKEAVDQTHAFVSERILDLTSNYNLRRETK